MRNKTKKIILGMIIGFIALILSIGEIKAGLNWQTGYLDSILNDSGVYCVQHSAQRISGQFNVERVITIDTANANKADRKLAYILAGGNYAKGYGSSYDWGKISSRQKALWGYWNLWIDESGRSAELKYWKDTANDLVRKQNDYKNGPLQIVTEAENFANNTGRQSGANVEFLKKPEATSNTMAGPFSVKYTGNISSIVVKDESGNEIQSGIQIYVNNKAVDASSVADRQDFYIRNTSGRKLKYITVNVAPTSTSKEYEVTINFLQRKGTGKQRLIYVGVKEKGTNPVNTTIEVKTLGNLTISKVDKDNPEQKLNAEFKLRYLTGHDYIWVGENSDGSFNYNADFEHAKTFATEVDGSKEIKDLEYGTYEVYEVKAPDGYDLSKQDGYENKFGGVVNCGKVEISPEKPNATYSIPNAKVISISGYVWIDNAPNKSDYDSIYNAQAKEIRVPGVTVSLVNKSTNKVIAKTTTNSDGSYEFKDVIRQSMLKDYYVEFNYNDIKIKDGESELNLSRYIPVAFKTVANGSKALVDEMPTADADFRGIASTYKGTEKESTYGLSGELSKLFNDNNNTLENINLGIKPMYDPDYQLTEDLAYVKVDMKGYTYKYNYGRKGNTAATAAPQVQFETKGSPGEYTRAVYPSDIKYESNHENSLKVYVVYRIDITDNEQYNVEEIYQEQKLYISSVVNTFDAERYQLNDNNWDAKSEGTAQMKNNYLNEVYGNGIAKGETKTSYIEFSVKRNALLGITKEGSTERKEFPTKAVSKGYHEYTRKDYSWANGIEGIQKHTTGLVERHDSAPFLRLKLGEERTISGIVFEDGVITTDGQKLGNGQYDNNEKVVGNVTVELLDNINAENATKVYPKNEETQAYEEKEAVAKTNAKGQYSIVGVVPGDYYLRFTYGNGTQKIYDVSGNLVKDAVSSDKYKSTIISKNIKNVMKDAFAENKNENTVRYSDIAQEGQEKKPYYVWYEKLGIENKYSTAKDIFENKVEENKLVKAGTPKLSIPVEGTGKSESNVNENGELEDANINVFNGFNFGIIERPEQKVEVEKIVTNMKLVNTQNNIIFDGNPATADMQGVSDLSKTTKEGSSFVKAEISEDAIYGSTLNVKYKVKVTNTSDVNYYNDEYYFYGEADANKEVTLTPEFVCDYLDKTLKYENSTYSVTDVTASYEASNGVKTYDHGGTLIPQTVLKIDGFNTKLYTARNTTRSGKDVKTSDSMEISAQRILSSEDDDLAIVNEAQVLRANTTQDINEDVNFEKKVTIKTITSEPANALVTVTPPTGGDKVSPVVYVASGIIALIILSTGIVVIKKKVV